MPEHGGFTRRLDLWLNEELYRGLEAEALRRGVRVTTVARDLLAKGLVDAAAREGLEAVVEAVRKAIKPAENRLAAMLQKSITAAATAMCLHTLALALQGEDAEELYQKARKKAAEYLRQRRGDALVEQAGGESDVREIQQA